MNKKWVIITICFFFVGFIAYKFLTSPLVATFESEKLGKINFSKEQIFEVEFTWPKKGGSFSFELLDYSKPNSYYGYFSDDLKVKIELFNISSNRSIYSKIIKNNSMSFCNYHSGQSMIFSNFYHAKGKSPAYERCRVIVTVIDPSSTLSEANIYLNWTDGISIIGYKKHSLDLSNIKNMNIEKKETDSSSSD